MTATHNAQDILVEALGTIQATFWIQSKEVEFAIGQYIDVNEYDWKPWDETDKAILAELDENQWAGFMGLRNPNAGDKAKVVGVCSIGALALANVTLYDEPLTPWMNAAERDFETWKAGQALAQVIAENEPYYLTDYSSAGDIIASWNDKEDRTREDVIEAFTKALDSPLLAATEVYEIVSDGQWGRNYTHLFFATRAAAQAFLDTYSPLRTEIYNSHGPEDLTVVPFVHSAQVPA